MNLPNSQQTPLDKFLRVFLRAIGKIKKKTHKFRRWNEHAKLNLLLPYTALESHVSGQAACNVLMPCQKKGFREKKFPVCHWTSPMFTAIWTAVGQMVCGKILKLHRGFTLCSSGAAISSVLLNSRGVQPSGGQELHQGGWLHTWWPSSAYQVLIANRDKWKKSKLGSPTHCLRVDLECVCFALLEALHRASDR